MTFRSDIPSFLPYAETSALSQEPEARFQVDELILEEARRHGAKHPMAMEADEVDSFLSQRGFPLNRQSQRSDLLREEYKTIGIKRKRRIGGSGKEMYHVTEAPGNGASLMEWEEALRHNRLVLENLEMDMINLELQRKFGGGAWKVYAQSLEGLKQSAELSLDEVRRRITEINSQRKATHLRAIHEEESLKQKWLKSIENIKQVLQALDDIDGHDGVGKRRQIGAGT